jgi:hypothetical protein
MPDVSTWILDRGWILLDMDRNLGARRSLLPDMLLFTVTGEHGSGGIESGGSDRVARSCSPANSAQEIAVASNRSRRLGSMVEGGGDIHGRERVEEHKEISGHFEGVHVHLLFLDGVDMDNVQVLNAKSSCTNHSTLAAVG